jgi:hypothetical protein
MLTNHSLKKSISFSEVVETRSTYDSAEYDRSASGAAQLDILDIYELVIFLKELREQYAAEMNVAINLQNISL